MKRDATPSLLGTVERVLADALALVDASLVIFLRSVLIELKTELLKPGLALAFEGNHRSWQLRPFEGHHCRLDLAAVERFWFDAEPVSCQGGRLNYTVWFLSADDCGNPYRPDGLFSVTLNAPYRSTARLAPMSSAVSTRCTTRTAKRSASPPARCSRPRCRRRERHARTRATPGGRRRVERSGKSRLCGLVGAQTAHQRTKIVELCVLAFGGDRVDGEFPSGRYDARAGSAFPAGAAKLVAARLATADRTVT